MSSTKDVALRPWASPPLATQRGLRSGSYLRAQSETMSVRSSAIGPDRGFEIPNGELTSEITDVVFDIFKEDRSDRAQARKFLWEFFD